MFTQLKKYIIIESTFKYWNVVMSMYNINVTNYYDN